MRIAMGGILHETSTFVQTRTTLTDFQHSSGIARGAEMIERFRGTNVCSGGFVDRLEEEDGVEIVPLLRASAFPGGLIDAADYAAIKRCPFPVPSRARDIAIGGGRMAAANRRHRFRL